MARRPGRVPRWASDAAVGALVEPPSGEAADGWPTGARPPAEYLNWLFHHYGAWIDFLRGAGLANWERASTFAFVLNPSLGAARIAADTVTVEAALTKRRLVIAAVDSDTSAPCIYVSRRGNTWAGPYANFPVFTGVFTAVRFLGARWWLLADDGTVGTLLWSTADGAAGSRVDGTGTWDAATLPASTPGLLAMAYDPAGWFACVTATTIIASSSGTTFTAATITPTLTGDLTDVVWTGSLFVAITDDGEVIKASGGSGAAGAWALASDTLASRAWRLAVGPEGELIAYAYQTGSGASLWRSTDGGTTWTDLAPTIEPDHLTRLVYASGAWVASSTVAPYLWTSNDLVKWLRLPLPYVEGADHVVRDVVYCEGAFVAVRAAAALVSERAEDLAPGAWTPDPTATALSDAGSIQGVVVSDVAPTDGQVLTYDAGDDEARWADPAGGSSSTVRNITADATAASGDIIIADATGGLITVTLPALDTGLTVTIKRTNGAGSNVKVEPDAGGTIDGAGSLTMTAQYESATLVCDGSNWWVI